MIIYTKSYPRAAIIGNPSDGYYGKTIAFVFSNFSADVTLYESPEIEIQPATQDLHVFQGLDELVSHINFAGYYGGIRLLKAMIKVFYEYCKQNKIELEKKNFTLRYKTDIPQHLGLAGSSAIITAGMKALMQFYKVEIDLNILANLILSVETQELGISAGLQDRVAQVYEHPVFMDFNKDYMAENGFGIYTPLNASDLPNFYIAYKRDESEGSELTHNNLRARYQFQDKEVLKAIEEWGELSVKMKRALEQKNYDGIPTLINRNFDLRKSLISIKSGHKTMIDIARSAGASAKFTGSGGAIIGTYTDTTMYNVLKIKLKSHDIEVLKPKIVTNQLFS
jgi:glucuronokinase